jgi:hypothetical protein
VNLTNSNPYQKGKNWERVRGESYGAEDYLTLCREVVGLEYDPRGTR